MIDEFVFKLDQRDVKIKEILEQEKKLAAAIKINPSTGDTKATWSCPQTNIKRSSVTLKPFVLRETESLLNYCVNKSHLITPAEYL